MFPDYCFRSWIWTRSRLTTGRSFAAARWLAKIYFKESTGFCKTSAQEFSLSIKQMKPLLCVTIKNVALKIKSFPSWFLFRLHRKWHKEMTETLHFLFAKLIEESVYLIHISNANLFRQLEHFTISHPRQLFYPPTLLYRQWTTHSTFNCYPEVQLWRGNH